MRIEPFSVRLRTPLETADGSIDERAGFLVRVEHAGQVGVGEATPLPGWTESREACSDALERAGAVANELDWGIALARMETPAARHGLALALADARAKAVDLPLYRTFGTDHTVRRIPVNATLGDAPPDETAERAREAVSTGFGCLKVKVGRRDLAADVRRVDAVREVVGDHVLIRVDANGAWNAGTAREALDELDALDVTYVEQPLPAPDLEGLAALRRADGDVGVAVDETLIEHDLDAVLAAEAADVVVCKPMVLGGPDRAAEVAMHAWEAGVEPIVSTTVDAVVARTAAVHVAATVPEVGYCGLATADHLAEDLGRDPAPVEDGAVYVPQDKGLGLADRPEP